MNQSLAFAITATAISGLLLFCWIMELRTIHRLRETHDAEIAKLRLDAIKAKGDFDAELAEARHKSWCEGVRAGAEATKRKRDKAGRFA